MRKMALASETKPSKESDNGNAYLYTKAIGDPPMDFCLSCHGDPTLLDLDKKKTLEKINSTATRMIWLEVITVGRFTEGCGALWYAKKAVVHRL